MRKFSEKLLPALGAALTLLFLSAPAIAQTPVAGGRTDLENLIRGRTEELEKINRELEEVQQNLSQTQTRRQSLQNELNRMQQNIRQLELSIRSDEAVSQRLGYEVESLQYDIRDIELSITDKKDVIARLFQEMQKTEESGLLFAFLKHASLTDGLRAVQSFDMLRQQLAVDIENLSAMQAQLGQKVVLTSDKRAEIERRREIAGARKNIIEDQKANQSVVLAQTKNTEEVYAQQLVELEKQQKAIESEINEIEDRLRSEFDTGLLPSKRSGVLAWPILLKNQGGKGIITQHYGEYSRLYKSRSHNGLDIGAPIGTPVMAAEDGVVMAVDNNDTSAWRKYQYGKYILLRHDNGLATLYAHLSRQAVATGERVTRGQIIGYSGNTGYSTGPHLHLGAYWAASIQMKSVPPAAGLVPVGVLLNPEDYL